jgi:hypothetical protein
MPTLDEKPATTKSAKNRKRLAPALPAIAARKLATATGKQAAATGKQAAASAGKQAGNSQMGIEAQSFYKSPVKKSTKSEKVGGHFLYTGRHYGTLFPSGNIIGTVPYPLVLLL